MKAISITDFNNMTNNEKWQMITDAYREIRDLEQQLEACKAELDAVRKTGKEEK